MAYAHAVLGESEEATRSAVEWGLHSDTFEEKINKIKESLNDRLTPLILSSSQNNKTSAAKPTDKK